MTTGAPGADNSQSMDTFDRTRLVTLRERRGLTQRELAVAARVSETYIQGLENGRKSNPSLEVLGRIAAALDVPVMELTTGSAITRDVSLADMLRSGRNAHTCWATGCCR